MKVKKHHGYLIFTVSFTIKKMIKVEVTTISDHPYPWHEGSPTEEAKPQKNSNRSGEGHKSRKSANSKQNKKRWY